MVHSRNSLLIALIVTTVVVTGALSWAGWRLLDQQRALDQQNAQRTQDAAAGSMAASIRGKLAEAGDHLSTTVANPAAPPTAFEAAVLLKVGPDASVTVAGEHGLPFVPVVPSDSGSGEVFAEGHVLEFVRNNLTAAASLYRGLSDRRDEAVRAGALLRLGRVEVKAKKPRAALVAYRQLATMGPTRVEGLPAEFVGLIGQRVAANVLSDPTLHQSLTERLIRGLDAGAWALTRRQAAFYREELQAPEAPPAWNLAEAVDDVWTEFGGSFPPRGQRVSGDDSRRVLVMWRTGSTTTAVLAAFLDEFLPTPPAGAQWRLVDPEGRWVAGQRTDPGGPVFTRLVGDSDFPWTLSVGGTTGRESVNSQRALLAMMAAMLVFLWAALYFMARAIRREAVVARLQSDFVAAVSHEFRSPLTTIRQMTEMLEMGRVAGDDRRQAYYQVLTGETARLQRLVETLLNFGRMEAGAARYTMGDVDVAALIRRVVREVTPIAAESGKRIELDGSAESLLVRADENALALAVRNLLDNAIKYSPDGPAIRVEWGREDGHAAIRVIDRGIGIPPGEQRSIFEKFVRGHSAIEANVAGTGLGLSMVRQILDAHDGAVRVESEVGRGSTFTLVLPMIDDLRADLKVGPGDGDREVSPYDDTGHEELGRGRPSGLPAADAAAQS